MALALYRKYRPATFAEVVGQEHVTAPLRTALAAGRINHAYLFSGPRGCGKTSSARILARSLNCAEGPTPDPCGVCASCVALAPEGPGSLDVVELDAASHGGVSDTRELRDRAFYMPAESRYRVFIIDEAHMVTKEGFNALLKIVEEPPEHLVFVFATTEPEKVLPTIRSRTHHYPFHLLPPATLRGLLEKLCGEEGVAVEPAVYPLVVKAGAGSARDALSVMDQLLAGAGATGVRYADAVALLGVTDAALLDEMVDALAAADGASVFGAVERVVEAGHDPRRFGADLLQRLRDLVILQAVPDAVTKGLIDAPEDQLAAMVHEAERLPAATLTRFAEILHTGLAEMRGTTAPRLVLELLCARMLLPAASLDDAGLLQRLERLERRLDIAADHVVGSALRGDDGARGAGPVPTSDADGGAARGAPGGERSDRSAKPAAVRPGPAPSQPVAAAPVTSPVPATAAAAAAAGTAGPDLGLPKPPVLSSSRPRQTDNPLRADAAPAAEPDAAQPPTAPEPASAQQVPSTEVGVADVRRVWNEVLAAVKQHRRTTQVLLESATVTALDAGVLVLAMPTAALARRLNEPGNVDVLRAALRDVLGVDVRIRCESGEPPLDAAAAPHAPEWAERSDGHAAAPAARRGGGAGHGRAADSAAASRPSSTPVVTEHVPSGADEPNPYDDLDPDDNESPGAPSYQVVDPNQAAIDLLTSRLGAHPIDDAR